jgi:prepilin-type processing-associated H-X9-DG protein
MPAVYACPDQGRALTRDGKTTYLTPRGPATIFPGAESFKIQEITDGTSNTIFVVDASDDLAVTWTKPDDWQTTPEVTTRGLFGHHPGGLNVGFADGSVHFVRETIVPKILQALTTRNGGEVIARESY